MAIDGFDDFDAMASHEQQKASGGGTGLLSVPKDVELWWPKPEETGPSRIVILPYKTTASPYTQPGKPHYFRDYYVYRNLGADGKGRYFDCKRSFNEACPVGDAMASMTKKPKSQRLALINVLQLLDDGAVKHAVMDFSHFNFLAKLLDDIAAKIKKNEKKYGYLRKFVVSGTVIDFSWETESFEGAKYCFGAAFDYEPWDGDIEEWYPKAVNLDTVFNKMSYAAAQHKFFGLGAPEHVEQEVEEPVKKTEKPKESVKQDAGTDEESKFKKGDTVYYDGGKYSVVKTTPNGIKILDDEGEVKLVQEEDLSLDPPAPKAKDKAVKTESPKAKASATVSQDDGDWDNWADE